MVGNAVVYTALSQPGDVIMSAAQPVGGHSSNRIDGPAGAMGRKVVDVPFDPQNSWSTSIVPHAAPRCGRSWWRSACR